MIVERTARGFEIIRTQIYPGVGTETKRLVQQSSAIGDYEDSLDKPGSSFVWVGEDFHFDREQVAELVFHLQRWLETGSFSANPQGCLTPVA